MKGERQTSESLPQRPNKLLSFIKEEPQKEVLPSAKLDFNPTGDIDIEEEEGLGVSFKVKKKKKRKRRRYGFWWWIWWW